MWMGSNLHNSQIDLVVKKYSPALITAPGHIVKGIRILYTEWTNHYVLPSHNYSVNCEM